MKLRAPLPRTLYDGLRERSARNLADRATTAAVIDEPRLATSIVAQTRLPLTTVWLVLDAQHNHFVDVDIDTGPKRHLHFEPAEQAARVAAEMLARPGGTTAAAVMRATRRSKSWALSTLRQWVNDGVAEQTADQRYVPAGSRATADPPLSDGQERVLLTLLDDGRGLPTDTITVAARFVHAGDADALIRLGYAEAVGRLVRLTGSGRTRALRVHDDYYDVDD